jgi:hypothetical protein
VAGAEVNPKQCARLTNLETDCRAVARFYNKRGTAERWIRESKQAVKMTRLPPSASGGAGPAVWKEAGKYKNS